MISLKKLIKKSKINTILRGRIFLKPLYGIVFFMVFVLSLSLRTPHESYSPSQQTINDTLKWGKQLALQYCQSCHIFPEPHLLDKNTWVKSVLPNMAMRLGLREQGQNPYQGLSSDDEKILRTLHTYPDSPLIAVKDWQFITRYYETEAPNELPLPPNTLSVASTLPSFQAYYLNFSKKKFSRTTALKYDTPHSLLYIGDAHNEVFVMDSLFQIKSQFQTESPVSDIHFGIKGAPIFTTIGSIAPSDNPQGQLWRLDSDKPFSLVNNLARPVHIASEDFNKDGQLDILLCNFGNNTGYLSWLDAASNYQERILKQAPGARKTEIADFNRDKKPDIMVLMAQAQESISIFYNQGKGQFREKTVLKLPPVYGVSYFELVDFNKDGFLDILLTNGDNWDFSAIRKPYHGVRLYENDGHDNFKEVWFYPLYGASKAIARDFDNDGDLDIAAIAFYTALDDSQQSFTYLQNEGKLHFKAFSTPEASAGKWLTMEVGDFDKDGLTDIILGSYFHTAGEVTQLLMQGVTYFPQLLFLKNRYSKQ